MRVARAIGVFGFSCMVGFGCAERGGYTPQTYVVRPQDTLYSIAWRHDLDYRELARWNNLGPDYRIAVGQILMLEPAARGAVRPAPRSPPAPPSAPRVSAAQPLAGVAPSATPAPAHASAFNVPSASPPSAVKASPPPNPPSGEPMRWVWPTAHAEAPRPVPGGGILLLGHLGQPIRAASAGRVVYVGSGLRGYGNLIIIKHGDTLLSAYAHTRELAVHEGQEVTGGQVIAEMGTGPHQTAALYFEIRLNGKPVDPLPYLGGAK